VGQISPEKHFGGRGNDTFSDDNSAKNPVVFLRGPGRDEVLYNKGLDKAADDCEILQPR
jgi:hypothetical protein